MSKYIVTHKKKECIGCGACAAVAPDYWEMDEEGFAHLKKSVASSDVWILNIDTEEAKVINQEAADVCPVDIISVKTKD
ncbi:ferredoxin [Candidatus Woesearchaeota archaeon CG10_big_fil_rev_8_21_14_0_10_36_11]|nr:MAG: ferredoxin [Candidatus Woesearchaeota archaeon CG10_big_fil_rev_8_21_14_0_10_36_11]